VKEALYAATVALEKDMPRKKKRNQNSRKGLISKGKDWPVTSPRTAGAGKANCPPEGRSERRRKK